MCGRQWGTLNKRHGVRVVMRTMYEIGLLERDGGRVLITVIDRYRGRGGGGNKEI